MLITELSPISTLHPAIVINQPAWWFELVNYCEANGFLFRTVIDYGIYTPHAPAPERFGSLKGLWFA